MGFFINRKTTSAGMVHRTGCPHAGDTSWSAADEGASLTAREKICSDSVAELMAWAGANHLRATECVHCKPSDKHTHQAKFAIGQAYTRKQISDRLGGNTQAYLPQVNGRVVCACLRTDLNPDAPNTVLVGAGKGIERAGAVLASQKELMPVFIKEATNRWIYRGNFRVDRSTQARIELARHSRATGRAVTRIIYLLPVGTGHQQATSVDRPILRELQPTADPQLLEERTNAALEISRLPKPPGQDRPKRVETASTVYERDPMVRAFVFQRAKGKCECCKEAAPFIDLGGHPFLEVHHIIPLCDGGPDIVDNAAAICPNCHRECHHGRNAATLRKKLLRIARSSAIRA